MGVIVERPTAKAMWYPTLIMNSSMFLHKLTVLILHYLPAFLLDLAFIVSGKKLRSALTDDFIIKIQRLTSIRIVRPVKFNF